MYVIVALSLVRLAFILYGLLEQKGPHVHNISTNFAIVQRKFNDTNSFHYFHKNL